MNYLDLLGVKYLKQSSDASKGLDCWGLVIAIYARDKNIVLPILTNYDSEYLASKFRRVDNLEEYDICTFKIKSSYINHVGIVMNKDQFLHVHEKGAVQVERLKHRYWQNRLEGCYRWKQ